MSNRPLDLSLFGGFRLAEPDGESLELSVQKGKSLLAWLALQPSRPHPREQIANLLWPHADTARARHSLRQLLTALRRQPPLAELVGTDNQQLWLTEGALTVDALHFDTLLAAGGSEGLADAVALYHGELLEGFNPRSEQLESWLATRRSHYREQACTALHRLVDDRLEAQHPEAALRYAVRLSGIDPLNEAAHRDVMRCYARLGRNAEALKHYRRCRRLRWRSSAS